MNNLLKSSIACTVILSFACSENNVKRDRVQARMFARHIAELCFNEEYYHVSDSKVRAEDVKMLLEKSSEIGLKIDFFRNSENPGCVIVSASKRGETLVCFLVDRDSETLERTSSLEGFERMASFADLSTKLPEPPSSLPIRRTQ
jgi:hypothetical protein